MGKKNKYLSMQIEFISKWILNARYRGEFMGILNGLDDFLTSLLYTLPAVLISLSFHEFGHAYAAYKNGDPTARNHGRMTLNPIAHIDIWGFILIMLVGFGWAKPVPVNPINYKNYKKGELCVSLAGVTMNLLLAFIGAIIYEVVIYTAVGHIGISAMGKIVMLLYYFIILNCSLMVFNLLPIYPLDGFHVAQVLLSKYIGLKPFMFLRKYGQYILLIVMLLGNRISFISTVSTTIAEGLFAAASGIVGLFF